MAEEIVRTVTVVNRLGIHARAAAKSVTLASRFDAEIQVRNSRRTVNGKSIMGVMMLAAAKGCTVTLETEGDDEMEAIEALAGLISSGFGEEM